jgi:hypothetical protein
MSDVKNIWGRNWWLGFRQRRPGAEYVIAALPIPLGWAIGSIIASAPSKTGWVGTVTLLICSSIFQGWRYNRQVRRESEG